jgi:L-alanine-DL-glutamate epimerase-like enolase superfamily enzyme
MNKKLHLTSVKNPSSRRTFLKKASIGGLSMGLLGNNSEDVISADYTASHTEQGSSSKIIITDLRVAMIGRGLVVRVTTDAGISGYGQIEAVGLKGSGYKPFVLFYKDYLINEDPTNVERVMMKIRRMGGFKPWGSAVSAIEMALWDIAGKAASLPVYKLLGGKVRDQVRAYASYGEGIRFAVEGTTPQHYRDWAEKIKASGYGFTIIKENLAFQTPMKNDPNFTYRNLTRSARGSREYYYYRGPLKISGYKMLADHVEGMRRGLGDEIDLGLDFGPGFMLSDAIKVAKLLEPYNPIWLEDMLTGDYNPYVLADNYRRLTESTTAPIHTGEQIYLRQNFLELIDRHAVDILGPDPADMGGISELKWVSEHADLYGIQMAPHGTFNGLLGLAAQVQVGATMPENYIAFEYTQANPSWWYDIVEGLPDPIVRDGLIDVWDRPGMGVDFIVSEARKHLSDEDRNFFD